MLNFFMSLPFWAWLCYAVISYAVYKSIPAALQLHRRLNTNHKMYQEALQWMKPYYALMTSDEANIQWKHLEEALPPVKGYRFYGEIITGLFVVSAIGFQYPFLLLPAVLTSIITMTMNLGTLSLQDSIVTQVFNLEEPSTRQIPRLHAFKAMACSHLLHLYAYHTNSTILGTPLDNPSAYLQKIDEAMKKTILSLKAEAQKPLYPYPAELKWLIKFLCDCSTVVNHNITLEQFKENPERFSELSLALCKQCLSTPNASSN